MLPKLHAKPFDLEHGMLGLIVARTGLARHEAYALASLVVDLRVTQVVNGNKGIHAMIARERLVPRGG